MMMVNGCFNFLFCPFPSLLVDFEINFSEFLRFDKSEYCRFFFEKFFCSGDNIEHKKTPRTNDISHDNHQTMLVCGVWPPDGFWQKKKFRLQSTKPYQINLGGRPFFVLLWICFSPTKTFSFRFFDWILES